MRQGAGDEFPLDPLGAVGHFRRCRAECSNRGGKDRVLSRMEQDREKGTPEPEAALPGDGNETDFSQAANALVSHPNPEYSSWRKIVASFFPEPMFDYNYMPTWILPLLHLGCNITIKHRGPSPWNNLRRNPPSILPTSPRAS